MCVCGVTCYTCYYANMLCLDLFCGEGGAAMGYHKAGFEVIGVDKYAQPRYPFEFKRMDAFKALENTHGIDLIHASPPCQSYSKQVAHWAHEQPRYIEELRKILKELAIPYIIEQPPSWGALHNPVTLCGSMFGLRIRHHREFESNLPLQLTLKCNHDKPVYGIYNREALKLIKQELGTTKGPIKLWAEHVGLSWMTNYGATQAVPPVYTEYLGNLVRAFLT